MIRRMQPKEIEVVSDIWLQGNLEAHSFVKKNYWINNLNSVKEQFKEADIYVFVDNEQIMGFAGLQKNYLAGIFVKKEYQNHGVGRKLLDYLKREYSELSLDVYDKNIQAKNFYLQNNFKVIHENIDKSTNEVEYQMSWKGE
ncbi:GNAT family N-acetyltransferase [Companilactobacillus paralimentarius]|jgi:Acetyltransferases|nr:GNAT family N-acetyltransferase [Companilactobacillus paralimentarius]KAE9565198.1 acetyltransferase [Companilactobacillus paralimentarius]MDR4933486.1 GNAT family N-acetyltransferase [Companilactobacillus paralimentarius]QFR70677.1 GNAT family N-acetyltransferase [Companilactobacillus paralimentarius]